MPSSATTPQMQQEPNSPSSVSQAELPWPKLLSSKELTVSGSTSPTHPLRSHLVRAPDVSHPTEGPAPACLYKTAGTSMREYKGAKLCICNVKGSSKPLTRTPTRAGLPVAAVMTKPCRPFNSGRRTRLCSITSWPTLTAVCTGRSSDTAPTASFVSLCTALTSSSSSCGP